MPPALTQTIISLSRTSNATIQNGWIRQFMALSMHRYSCPQRLYKYLGYDGLQKTLLHRSIKLSRPTDFNDPLDMFLQEALGMEESDFLHGLKTAFYEFVSGDIDYTSLRDSPNTNKIILMNMGLKNAAPDVRESIKKEILDTPIEQMWDLQQIRTVTREALDFLKEAFRQNGIFCSTIDCNNLLMWAHYADQHRGAVIEFTPCIERDSALLASRVVKYSDTRPLLYRDPVDLITHGVSMTAEASVRKIVDGLIYTKGSAWSYEKEYRLNIPKFIDHNQNFATLAFHSEELTAVYLGCRMDDEKRLQIIALVESINPSIQIYEAHISPREFGLHFVKIIKA